MRKKRRSSLFFIAIIFALIATCGSIFAYMFKQTEIKENNITPASVSCTVTEVINKDQETQEVVNENVSEKNSIKVKNTGNIDAYLRVRLVSYWIKEIDGELKIIPKASVVPEFNVAEGWLKGSDNIYYYQYPIKPGESTGELLASVIYLAEEDDTRQAIEVFAEAIQSKPDSSVIDSWHVEVNDEGIIVSAP